MVIVFSKKRCRFKRVHQCRAKICMGSFLSSGKFRQTATDKGRLCAGTVYCYGLHGTTENTVNFRKFCLNTLHGAAGQGYTQIAHGNTFLIGQNTGRAVIARQIAFLRTQNNQMLLLMQPHGTDLSALNRVQNRRNRTHLILAQQQLEQPLEGFCFPLGTAKNIMHLLHGANQDFPKLIKDLRAAIVTGSIHLLCQRIQSGFQFNVL